MIFFFTKLYHSNPFNREKKEDLGIIFPFGKSNVKLKILLSVNKSRKAQNLANFKSLCNLYIMGIQRISYDGDS